jgi:predicted aminopeptidase
MPDFKETLTKLIPGYSGYAESEKRRASDREVRKLLGKRIDECKAKVTALMKDMKAASRFDQLMPLDRLHSELDLAGQKTLAAYEGYSSWFVKDGVDAAKLAEVTELDESLISLTDQMIQSVPQKLESVTDLQTIGELIDLYRERFEKRRFILHG